MKTNAFQKSQDIAFKIKRQYNKWHETYKEWNDFYSNSDFSADVQIKLEKGSGFKNKHPAGWQCVYHHLM